MEPEYAGNKPELNNRQGERTATWNGWTVVRLLGMGASGRVYELEKPGGFRSALKVISIPQDRSEIEELSIQGMDSKSISDYYSAEMDSLVDEFKMMYTLRGQSNFVSYEDHEVRRHANGIGGEIYIRMELLTPLQAVMSQRLLTEREIIRLGIDLCKALDVCEKRHILHRDIKPQNIFVNANGDYKLGDFGIARTLEKTSLNLSRKGTYSYMAPEVYKGEPYGHRADIYSLGIVLYQLLNDNRLPFLPAGDILPADRENAFMKRVTGSNLPVPVRGSRLLQWVVFKAAAYNPENRYRNASELLNDLENCQKNMFWGESDAEKTARLIPGQQPVPPFIPKEEKHTLPKDNQTFSGNGKKLIINPDPNDFGNQDKRKRVPLSAIAAVAAFVILFVIASIAIRGAMSHHDSSDNEEAAAVTTSQDVTETETVSTTLNTTETTTVTTTQEEAPPDIVIWTDPNLENAVKNYLFVDGDLTLEEAAQVKRLDCNGAGITDISSLKYFTGLEELSLAENQISEFPKELSDLRRLSVIHLESNSISDVNPFREMFWLKELDLCDNMVSDITPLRNLTKLTMLDLRENKVTDITPLKSMTEMLELFISTNRLTDISPIAGMKKLTYLSISHNSVSDISCIKDMKDLAVLTMVDNKVTDISVLRNLKKIYHLKILDNPIKDYSPLDVFSDKVYIDYRQK